VTYSIGEVFDHMRCSLGFESSNSNVQVFHLQTGDVFVGGLTEVNWERVLCLIGGVVNLLFEREGLSWLKERTASNLSSESLMEQI